MNRAYLHCGNSVYQITNDVFKVGSNPFCNIVLNYNYISDIHFCIKRLGDMYIFCDGDMKRNYSMNGTIVDGIIVDKGNSRYLTNSSVISIHTIRMIFIVKE